MINRIIEFSLCMFVGKKVLEEVYYEIYPSNRAIDFWNNFKKDLLDIFKRGKK